MNCWRFLNKSILAKCFLLLAVLILGFFQLRNSYANRLNNRACKIGIGNSTISKLDQAIRLNGDNPLYYANLGLLYARMDSSITLDNFYSGTIIYSKELDSAVFYYHTAEFLKKKDPLFCLNLALLYALKGDSKEALENVKKVSDETNDVWCLLISAFLYEKFDKKKAEEYYLRALFLSPDLFDSLLYSNLMLRDSLLGIRTKNQLLSYLMKSYNETEDPLIMARFAKILWNEGNSVDAEFFWNKVTKKMPMWSKPWLYLGKIAEERRDTINALSYYHKAKCLDPFNSALSLSGKELNDSINTLDIDTLLKYMSSERELVYRKLFNTILLSEGIVVNDFDKYRKVVLNW